MTRAQLDAALDAIAMRYLRGEDCADINLDLTDLARRSGYSFAFLQSNATQRANELRKAGGEAHHG